MKRFAVCYKSQCGESVLPKQQCYFNISRKNQRKEKKENNWYQSSIHIMVDQHQHETLAKDRQKVSI